MFYWMNQGEAGSRETSKEATIKKAGMQQMEAMNGVFPKLLSVTF
jgi:hypothetical protein